MKKSRNISNQTKINHANDDHHSRQQIARTKNNPNDECYTPISEIERELTYWGELGKFSGKDIICPCDWSTSTEIVSVRFDFNNNDIVQTNNKVSSKLDIFNDLPDVSDECLVSISNAENFLSRSGTSNFIRVLVSHAFDWGIRSVTASGYNPKTNIGIKFHNIIFSDYDVCITNPPFSLYSDFMDCVVGTINFISIAPFLNRVAQNIGLPLMLNKAYIGKSGDEYGGYSSIDFITDTNEIVNVGCDWITTYPDAQQERNVRLENSSNGVKYEEHKDDYLVMTGMTMRDGTHPIRVPSKEFPEDYNGWMYASVNILSYISHNEYEWYGTNFMKYFNTTNPKANPFNHPVVLGMTKVGDAGGFNGIVFRRRPDYVKGN